MEGEQNYFRKKVQGIRYISTNHRLGKKIHSYKKIKVIIAFIIRIEFKYKQQTNFIDQRDASSLKES